MTGGQGGVSIENDRGTSPRQILKEIEMSIATALDNPERTAHTDCRCQLYSIEIWNGEVPEGGDPGEYVEYVGTGCTQQTRRTFAPGHDAKLKSLMIAAGVGGWSVRREDGGMATSGDAMDMAREFGFENQVATGIKRALAKREERAAKKAARVRRECQALERKAAKAEAAARPPKSMDDQRAERAAKAKPLVQPVSIKVGRWTYEAVINPADNSAEFTSANGETRVAEAGKYKLVESK